MTQEGRGYPNIESLKEISSFFSVSIDDLLSGEKLLFIAEKENKSNIQSMCDLLVGIIDIFYSMLIILPLYPNKIDGFIYSVNLLAYVEVESLNRLIYWSMFVFIMTIGVVKIFLTKFRVEAKHKMVTSISMISGILIVLFLALAREAYAVIVAFLLLIIKGIFIIKCGYYNRKEI